MHCITCHMSHITYHLHIHQGSKPSSYSEPRCRKAGNKKATVLPLPVVAMPMMSWLFNKTTWFTWTQKGHWSLHILVFSEHTCQSIPVSTHALPCTAKGQEYIWMGLGLAKPERLTCQLCTGSYGSKIGNKLDMFC